MTRDELIARKEAVQAELAHTRRALERAREEAEVATGLRKRFLQTRVAHLESRADALMSEEYRLRLQIDQAR